MAQKDLQEVLDRGRLLHNEANTKQAFNWYRDQVRKMVVPIERARTLGIKSPLKPGGMYIFVYDPKTKDELPYYDTQPLILCFNILKETFYGVNLHYLTPEDRGEIIRELTKIASSKFPDTHKIKMNWEILSYYVNTRLLNHAVKQYRYDHVKLAPMLITADAWKMSIFLPTEKFVKAHRTKVWKDAKNARR